MVDLRCKNSQARTSGMGLVSRVSPVHTAPHNCTRGEGRPFEVGNQVLILKPPQAPQPPSGEFWLQEIKHASFRMARGCGSIVGRGMI
jgi:hypothetical protein